MDTPWLLEEVAPWLLLIDTRVLAGQALASPVMGHWGTGARAPLDFQLFIFRSLSSCIHS